MCEEEARPSLCCVPVRGRSIADGPAAYEVDEKGLTTRASWANGGGRVRGDFTVTTRVALPLRARPAVVAEGEREENAAEGETNAGTTAADRISPSRPSSPPPSGRGVMQREGDGVAEEAEGMCNELVSAEEETMCMPSSKGTRTVRVPLVARRSDKGSLPLTMRQSAPAAAILFSGSVEPTRLRLRSRSKGWGVPPTPPRPNAEADPAVPLGGHRGTKSLSCPLVPSC